MALINLRNALMAGKRLPYDAEVEFLESTGTQWIDTGVNVSTVSNDFRVRGLVKFTDLSGGEHDILGSGNTRTPTMGRNGAQYFMWAEVSTSWYPASCDTNWHELDFSFSNPSGRTFSVDGSSYSTSSSNKFLGTDLWLFASYPGRYPVSCQIGHIQIFIDNILVRDYIPVRKGTVGYLYDRVSGKLFGNAGTGDFVLGPDVVPVEYIESHGTEYIDAGFATTGNGLRVRLACEKTTSSTLEMAIVGRNLSSGFELYFASEKCGLWNTSGKSILSDVPIVQDTKYLIDASIYTSGATLVINGDSKSGYFAPSGGNLANVTVFRHNYSFYFIGRVYPCEMWNNDVLTRSFYPVRVGTGSTWEGAMIDTLTRRIYRNAGTGAFTYGNDLKYPIPA